MSGTIALAEGSSFTALEADLTALDGPGLPVVMPAPMTVATPIPVAVEVEKAAIHKPDPAARGEQEARGRLNGLAAKIRTLLHNSRAKP